MIHYCKIDISKEKIDLEKQINPENAMSLDFI